MQPKVSLFLRCLILFVLGLPDLFALGFGLEIPSKSILSSITSLMFGANMDCSESPLCTKSVAFKKKSQYAIFAHFLAHVQA